MKSAVKTGLNLFSQLLILPLSIPCWLEDKLTDGRTELVFGICTHLVAMLPGLPGSFLRRAFYRMTLDSCSPHCHIGFGTLFSHRQASVGAHVYIGSYALLGSVSLGDHCLIGSRVSILSGEALHELGDDGLWTPYSPERLTRVSVGANVWIGEGAIIVASIGEGCMIGAGAVITTNVREKVMMAGNPARFVKTLA